MTYQKWPVHTHIHSFNRRFRKPCPPLLAYDSYRNKATREPPAIDFGADNLDDNDEDFL